MIFYGVHSVNGHINGSLSAQPLIIPPPALLSQLKTSTNLLTLTGHGSRN